MSESKKRRLLVLTGRWDTVLAVLDKDNINGLDIICSKAALDNIKQMVVNNKLSASWDKRFGLRGMLSNVFRFFKKYDEVYMVYNNCEGKGYLWANLFSCFIFPQKIFVCEISSGCRVFSIWSWFLGSLQLKKLWASVSFLFELIGLCFYVVFFRVKREQEKRRENKAKRVMFISGLLFLKGAGVVVRAEKFLKYVNDFDWKTVVLTTNQPEIDGEGKAELLKRVKEVKIIDSFEPVAEIGEFLQVPDEYIPWLVEAVKKGLEIARREDISVIYTTAKPYTDHLVGLVLSKLTRIPLVAEFRDEWANLPFGNKGRIRKSLEGYLERKVIENAKQVITNTKGQQEAFIKRYSYLSADKFVLIPNGFDSDDFKTKPKDINRNGKITFAYVGNISPIRTLSSLLSAVEDICKEEASFKEKLRFKVVGYVPIREAELVRKSDCAEMFEIVGKMRHKEAIREMQETDVLIAIANKESGRYIAGKTYEYLYSGRPILGLVPVKGDTAELIKDFGVGEIVEPDDINSIADVIKRFYLKFERGDWQRDKKVFDVKVLSEFERKNLVGKVCNLLEKVAF